MATGGGPAKDLFKNRRESLQYYSEQAHDRPPEFLRTVELVEEEPLPEIKTQSEAEGYKDPDPLIVESGDIVKAKKIKDFEGKRFNFSMNKLTIIGFIAIGVLCAALMFAAGAIYSYIKYQPATANTIVAKAAPAKTVSKKEGAKAEKKSPAPDKTAKEAAKPSVKPMDNAVKAESVPASALDPAKMNSSDYIKQQISQTLNAIEADIHLEDHTIKEQSNTKITQEDTKIGFPDVSDALIKTVDDKLKVEDGQPLEGELSRTSNPHESRIDVVKFPFAIELNTVDTRQIALDIRKIMNMNGLNAYVAQDISENGSVIYHVRIGAFKDYNQASVAIMKLNQPYSEYSKVVKVTGEEKIIQ